MTNKSRPSLCRLERVAIYHYASVCSMNGTILLTGVTGGFRDSRYHCAPPSESSD
jgi:hypothetical protein